MVQITTILPLLCSVAFQNFTKQYNKTYSDDEYNIRESIFCQNYNFITQHNLEYEPTLSLAINEFADWTDTEFSNKYTHTIPQNETNEYTQYDDMEYDDNVPGSFDWRDKGHVSPIKDQASCGSCWAFSTTGAIESHLSIYKQQNTTLSEQELVDCSRLYFNFGCSGGLVDRAFRYVVRRGITTEANYPYTARDHLCKVPKDSDRVYIKSWLDVKPSNEDQLTKTLYHRGPISVAIDASSKQFRFYKSGVITSCGTQLNHAVLLVGYGVNEDGQLYYTIKNSWGTIYGDNGYVRLSRGDHKDGTCGVALTPSFPIIV